MSFLQGSLRFVMPAKAGIPFPFFLERSRWKNVIGFISLQINLMGRFIQALRGICCDEPCNIKRVVSKDFQRNTEPRHWFIARNTPQSWGRLHEKSRLKNGTGVGRFNLLRSSIRPGRTCTTVCNKTTNGMPAFAGMTKRGVLYAR